MKKDAETDGRIECTIYIERERGSKREMGER